MSWRCRKCGEFYSRGNPCSCWLEAQANDDYDDEPRKSYRPTYKQIRACEKIAEEKGLWLPHNYKTDWKVASGFIAKFGDKAD